MTIGTLWNACIGHCVGCGGWITKLLTATTSNMFKLFAREALNRSHVAYHNLHLYSEQLMQLFKLTTS
jgi:hypothetical protein